MTKIKPNHKKELIYQYSASNVCQNTQCKFKLHIHLNFANAQKTNKTHFSSNILILSEYFLSTNLSSLTSCSHFSLKAFLSSISYQR